MKDDPLSRACQIRDRRAAAAFADPLRRRLVLTFAGGDRSLADVARHTGLDLKRLHYHVTALGKLGLVKIARRQRRAGRPIKFYRAVADAFFVPADVAPSPPHAALHAELRVALTNARDPSHEGMLYHLGEDGGPRMRAVSALQSAPSHAEYWRVLHLSRADAARLSKDVENCFKSFATRVSANAKPYLIHFALAPRAKP